MAIGWFTSLVIATAVAAEPVPPRDGMSDDHKAALARYGAGLLQARRDRLLTSIKSLEAAAKLEPDATAALRELIPIYEAVGRENEAIRAARKVLAANPHDADTAHTLARILHEAGDPVGAAAALKPLAADAALTRRPGKALAIYRDLAKLLEAVGDAAGAEAAHRQALAMLTEKRTAVLAAGDYSIRELEAETAETLERLGRAQQAARKFAAAAESFRQAHALYADRAKAGDAAGAARLEWNLAKLAASRREPQTAVTQLEVFLRRKPHAAEPYELLATALRDAGRGGEVVPWLQAYFRNDPACLPLKAVLAVELAREPATRAKADPLFEELFAATHDTEILRRLVRSYVETANASKVIAEIDAAYRALDDEALKTADEQRFAAGKAKAIADVLRSEKAWSEAVLRQSAADLRTGTRRTPQTWYLLGVLADRHRQLDLAAELYRTVVRLRKRDTEPDAYLRLIQVLARAHKPDEVAAICREGLRNAQWTVDWLNYYLARALADQGRAEDALAAADAAIKQAAAGQRLQHRLNKVSVLQKLDRWAEAVALAKSLRDEFPEPGDRAKVRYALAGAYWGAGKRAEAEAELRGMLDDDPDHAGAANDLGYHLADLGRDLGEAERLVRHAIDLDRRERHRSGDPEAENAAYLDSLGWVLFRRGKLADARDWLAKASAMPDGAADAVVWDHLGDVQFRLGEKAQAAASWGTAAMLYETDPRGKREGRLDEVRKKRTRVP